MTQIQKLKHCCQGDVSKLFPPCCSGFSYKRCENFGVFLNVLTKSSNMFLSNEETTAKEQPKQS